MGQIRIKDKTLLFDDEKQETVIKYNWIINCNNTVLAKYDGRYVSFSKLVLGLEDEQYIYFKTGDKLDFRSENIIICKNKSEFFSLSRRKKSSSKYKNVHYNSERNKYIVSVSIDRKQMPLMQFDQEDEAGLVADYMLAKHRGITFIKNYPKLSLKELEEKYNDIILKYGLNREVRISKTEQGVIKPNFQNNKSSEFVGVTYDTSRNKYIAQITVNRKHHFIKRSADERECAEAYDIEALRHFGINAKLNFPEKLNDYLETLRKDSIS